MRFGNPEEPYFIADAADWSAEKGEKILTLGISTTQQHPPAHCLEAFNCQDPTHYFFCPHLKAHLGSSVF